MKKVCFIVALTCLLGCASKQGFSVDSIEIPSYYHHYNYREFWKSKNVSFSETPAQQQDSLKGKYKDDSSTNFLFLGEISKKVLFLPQNERAEMLKQHGNYKLVESTDDYEIYTAMGAQTEFKGNPLVTQANLFVIKRDSASVWLAYQTFDSNPKKRKDYLNIVADVNRKVKSGATFTSSQSSD